MAKKNIVQSIVIFFLIIFFLSISTITTLVTDYWWFDSMGFKDIFLISLQSKIILFLISSAAFFIFVLINLLISSRLNKKKPLLAFRFKLLISVALSFFAGITTSSQWFTVLQYIKQSQFNLMDPVFMKDVSFYIFSLPFLSAVWFFAISTVVLTTILVLLDYLQTFVMDLFKPRPQPEPGEIPKESINLKSAFAEIKDKALVHLSILVSFIFILLAAKHYLERFSIMYSEKGIVVGAGYSDVVAYLPIVKILMFLAVLVAVLFIVWIFVSRQPRLKKRHILLYAVFLYILFGFVGPTVIPEIVQILKVSPNEINLEKPYIENNIRFTRVAYNLQDVTEKDFSVEDINLEKIEKAEKTIDNVRILDYRPLTQTYKQTQEIRLYYDLSGIDIDRYEIDGKYTQVMIAPRELDQSQITDNAKTWVNEHMVYTHGYGVVMSPVNSVTKEGLPNYIIKDVPPSYAVEEENIKIERPEIYYGEIDNNFVLVNTKTNEFDYPKGNTNEYVNYAGEGGVKLDSFFKKIMMAIRFADIKILLSSDITTDSRIMFIRDIKDRVSKITPFLALDSDPYLVISDGKLLWMLDAYTMSGNFPYSEKYGNINYIRNSVKVVVDAYTGRVTYYVVDIKDPLIMTYAKIFPKQFKEFSVMPNSVKDHIRYPEDLFKIQSEIYSTYHMDDVKVFYNKEDAWQIPSEIYGVGQRVKVEPYYMIMKLPEGQNEEFVLMTSFTPIKKDNMVAWMAARSDKEDYGKLLLYKFPKEKLVYGPLQIEAKIDQDSEISQQLTLWSQQGSRVTRGNLLVIPIEDSLLYIEPLYIQAETGQLPELKRVLVSDGERVVMEETLSDSLRALFGKSRTKRPTDKISTFEELVVDAKDYYNQIQDSMKEGNWAGIGDNLEKLGEVLEDLSS